MLLVPPMPSPGAAPPAPGVRCPSAVAASAASSSLRRRRSAVLSRALTTPSAALPARHRVLAARHRPRRGRRGRLDARTRAVREDPGGTRVRRRGRTPAPGCASRTGDASLARMSERQEQWEARYAAVDRLWSGHPNDWLPEFADPWKPGRALDLGCGEGADAVWLAERGWDVVGLDLSATAIARMEAEARGRGLEQRVRGVVLDVTHEDLPAGPFDLVVAFYLHGGPEPGSLDLIDLLARGAGLVSPGGRLLTAVHCTNPPWHGHHGRTYTPAELLAGLAGATEGWRVEAGRERWREVVGPDGEAGRRSDAVVCVRRPA